MNSINEKVKEYWEEVPCGTEDHIVKNIEPCTKEWFDAVENFRYSIEPMIFSVAQFSLHHGKKVLEIGVGAGTDHLQWARSGVKLYGVDLTHAAIELTKKRFNIYGFESQLTKIDAEELPFDDNSFDVVYSWGVIHHSNNPDKIISEIFRVLKKDGKFIGMFYNRYSIVAFKTWFIFCFLKLKPWNSLKSAIYNNMESIGTKAYTKNELKLMFNKFSNIKIEPFLTYSDYQHFFIRFKNIIPQKIGWFYGINAKK
jgi:ubiquinone/menaquinone biosynthesis C-methylase UbiE